MSVSKKISTIETIYELLPETSKSCEEIAKIVIQDEDEEGNQIQPEYKELFLAVCGWKKQGKSLPEMIFAFEHLTETSTDIVLSFFSLRRIEHLQCRTELH